MLLQYKELLQSRCHRQWKRYGAFRRAGVATPLFSVYSRDSIGLGELPDIKLLVDWCLQTSQSVIQLLPMNDVGFDFRPYDAQSTFGLDPMYLGLEVLKDCDVTVFRQRLQKLKKQFPTNTLRVDYRIKAAKLELLWEMFQNSEISAAFQRYQNVNHFWLSDYAFFKVIKEQQDHREWEQWPPEFRQRHPAALEQLARQQAQRLEFHRWLQWQLWEQFRQVKRYAQKSHVLLMGDMPFLVSRDSADVWAHQNYFKLDQVSGAPPDLFFAHGQRWGMPPYQWPAIASHGYDYVIQKLKYAEHFYDLFRIDHVVGMFRLWTISLSEPPENAGLNGRFDPAEESLWEEHGRKIISVMVDHSKMLPCAEDLGVVPECSYKVLEEFGIPGMEVQRWVKDWKGSCDFKAPQDYRKIALAVISTHDMAFFPAWWEYQAGTVDEERWRRMCAGHHLDFEALKNQLFDKERSTQGRLRWQEAVSSEEMLLRTLGLSHDQAREFLDDYRGSYGEKEKFWQTLGMKGPMQERSSRPLVRKALEKVSETASIFSVQLLQDYLSLGTVLDDYDSWEFRINFPGTMGLHNWTLRVPLSLEAMQSMKINATIKAIHQKADRVLKPPISSRPPKVKTRRLAQIVS